MKVWSKGLGRLVLNMDLSRYSIETDDHGNLLVKGKITDPVIWKFRLTINKEDIPGLLHIVSQKEALLYGLRHCFKMFGASMNNFAGRIKRRLKKA